MDSTTFYVHIVHGDFDEVLKYLEEYSNSILHVTVRDGFFPIHIASRDGHYEIVKLFLEHDKTIVNQMRTEYSKKTPLMLATLNKHVHIVRLLLQYDEPFKGFGSCLHEPKYTSSV